MSVRTRLEYEGPALVFVTTRVHEWTPVFRDPNLATILVDQLRQVLDHYSARTMGYVVMPHHIHLLVGLPEYKTISKLMQGFKIFSAKRLRPLIPSKLRCRLFTTGRFHLWHPRFDELVIESEKQSRIKLNYIHENPVRAGLVESPTDWPFSSAAAWLLDAPAAIPIDRSCSWLNFGPADDLHLPGTG